MSQERKATKSMYKDKIVLCGASAYEQKYYFNEDFKALPQSVQDELHIMCVMYTTEIGGVLTLEFDEEGELQFRVEALEADAMFDEIGSALRIKQIRKETGIIRSIGTLLSCILSWRRCFSGRGIVSPIYWGKIEWFKGQWHIIF